MDKILETYRNKLEKAPKPDLGLVSTKKEVDEFVKVWDTVNPDVTDER